MTEISAYMQKKAKRLELPIVYIDDLPEPLTPCISFEFDLNDENLICKLQGITRMMPDEASQMVFNISESPLILDDLKQNSSINVIKEERRVMIIKKIKNFFKKNPLFVSLLVPEDYKRQFIPFNMNFKRGRNYFRPLRNSFHWSDKNKGISDWSHFFEQKDLDYIKLQLSKQ
jgi:hypothetical protein